MKETSIFKIKCRLSNEGFVVNISEISVTESDKSFLKKGLRVSKNDLMKIHSLVMERHDRISYYTYCLEDQQDKATEILKSHISQKVNQYKSEIDTLMSFINN